MIGKINKKGYTLIPLSIYLKNGKVKVELALARGKQLHDKREAARRKAVERDMEIESRRR